MAREGLRVLVVAKKSLAEEQYQDFEVSGLCDFSVGFEPHPPHHLPSLPSALAQADVISEHTRFFSLPRTLLPRSPPPLLPLGLSSNASSSEKSSWLPV